ncbi:hypothetical protein [Pedobacter sp. SYSU D00535]|uniref:hypothetical protein n=1 Tax=Pedobacter sp. SYSU D00535 TaxID=2810308 RepID=UPI001A962189|nr:hypothetical protein [Pedobacter sp. SYSU D00535]
MDHPFLIDVAFDERVERLAVIPNAGKYRILKNQQTLAVLEIDNEDSSWIHREGSFDRNLVKSIGGGINRFVLSRKV